MSSAKRRSAKSVLFEYCQKRKIGPPYFETWAATSGYQAKVMIDGFPYPTSAVFSKKKDAEHDAAKACLASHGIFEEATEGVIEYDPEKGTEGYHSTQRSNPSSFETPPNGHSNFATPSPRPFNQPRSGGSSGGSVKMPKSVLHEFCQSQKLSLPQYETEASYDGNTLLGFHCVLQVKDEYFTTDRLHTNKRDAEHSVARKALNVFGYYTRSPLYSGSMPTPTRPLLGMPSFQTPETSYKNLLQEHLQQRNIETPDYETHLTDGGYHSQVKIEGKVFKAKDCCQTKKLAEQAAAKAGLIAMGVKDPEAVARRLLGRKSRGQYRSPGVSLYGSSLPAMTDQLNQTWFHSRKQSGFDLDDYDDIDGEFVDFQKAGPIQLKRSHDESIENEGFFGEPVQRPRKMQRVGEGSENNSRPLSDKRPRRRGEYEVEDVHLGNLTVGEAWPERRNIVIVGSEETSIPLVCQGDTERCVLENMSSGTLVDIAPGHRLVGLEGYYVVRSGQIVLRAEKCQNVVMPDVPDKVLVSCGVVVLHCIPRRDGTEISCDVNVLLKRYLCSQAFINVVRGLAQYFRCRLSDRPITLNTALIIAHIQDWMLEEVMAISSFSETALENVFQHTMKFDKRWVRFLKDGQLSKELKEVQEAANQELFRRANSGEDQNQDRFRPWRLPKGNFYHRILTTGVFIESPAEAAMRELKEETGIKLKLSDIHSSPYVELPQSDNLNPHKGDMARYYLCGIITEAESDVKETKEKEPAQESPADNPDAVSNAMESTVSTFTGTDSTSTSTPVGSSAGAYLTGSDPTVVHATSTNTGAYSSNTGAYSNNPQAYSSNIGAYSATTGSNNAGPFTTNIGAYSASAGAYSATTDTGSTNADSYSANTGTGPTNAGAYSATTGTGLTNAGAFSVNSGTESTNTGAYSTSQSSYAASYGTNSHFQSTNTPSYGTSSTYPGTNATSYGTETGYQGTYPTSYSADTASQSTKPCSFSTDTPPYLGTNAFLFNAETAQKDTDVYSSGTDTAQKRTDASLFSTDTGQKGTDESSVGTDTAQATDLTSSVQTDTPDKSESKEDSNVIRSPFVAGAVHEECKWFDVEEAREVSSIFQEIYRSHEFQKLLAKLKGIVSTM